MEETLVSVAAWYDNEMGYSVRLAETAALPAGSWEGNGFTLLGA
jgi:glyceraldehyde-3-phosphate dehydrogenase/erythrose-4-phosphate dehydrogenase